MYTENTQLFPAPWELTGRGYIVIYRPNSDFAAQQSFLPPEQAQALVGGFGALMAVRYESSNAGPYDELLMIPGKIRLDGRLGYTISKIYVSTMESVVNGRKNWAIPKEPARFSFQDETTREEKVSVTDGDEPIFTGVFERFGLPFPVNTRLLPLGIVQTDGGQIYSTNPHGSGTGRLAWIKSLTVNAVRFPDVAILRPVIAIQVDPFRMVFPKAKILPMS